MEIGFENGRNSNFQGLVTLTLDPAIRPLIDLYLNTKFHSNRTNFLWTDGRTDGHFPPILLGRLLEVDLINDLIECCATHCEIYLFADDAKLFKHILNACDHQSLQEGVSELHVWTQRWLLTLNNQSVM